MRIEVRDLVRRYGDVLALDGLTLAPSEEVSVMALIGPSGGGKSTLLRILGSLERADSGEVRVDGEVLPTEPEAQLARRRSNGFLFQAYNLFPHMSVFENVALPLREVHGFDEAAARDRAEDVLAGFGMSDHLQKHPGQLSGGQQQRVALGRAIAHRPALLLLDEPTSALDPELKAEILELVLALAEGGQRIILTTHEMGFARHVADRVAFLAAGKVVEEASADTLFDAPRSEQVARFFAKLKRF